MTTFLKITPKLTINLDKLLYARRLTHSTVEVPDGEEVLRVKVAEGDTYNEFTIRVEELTEEAKQRF